MKTIVISDETHERLKRICNANSLKLNNWVDQLILKELDILENDKEIDNKRIYKKGQ